MSSWFNIDSNKIKQLAANTLINAQKQIDKVLDIKETNANTENAPIINNSSTNYVPATNDDFFESFLGTQQPTLSTLTQKETTIDAEKTTVANWNSWNDNNSTSQIISTESQSDADQTELNINEDDKSSTIETSSTLTESIDVQQRIQSSLSITESSTITESSSSESAHSLRATLSIPSSESTVIGSNIDNSTGEIQTCINIDKDEGEINYERTPDTADTLVSSKRDDIDSWMNNRENDHIETNIEQSVNDVNDHDTSSSLLYQSAYPPDEFPTSSLIDDDLTPITGVVGTTHKDEQQQQQQQITAMLTDEDEDISLNKESISPTHTISSSNGNDNHSKDSSDDGKQTSCASSDIEVISSPSVSGGLAISTTDTYDKCRELHATRRPVVREVLVRFPSHPTNLKYHQQPLPMDNIVKSPTSHFDTPSWSHLIDEAATEQNHYHISNDENDNDHNQHMHILSETAREVGELKERLELREQAFTKLTDESNELKKINQSLKQSLNDAEQKTIHLTNEFQQTIENLSLKIDAQKQITQERDSLRRQLDLLQKQCSESSTTSGNTIAVLREKEAQIQQLLEEGEKLSKTQLQHTNIIKKLRAKEKESDSQLASLNSKIDKLMGELDDAKLKLQEKEESEKQLRETMKKLEKSSSYYEKEYITLKVSYDNAEEQIRSTKVALENSYKEIAELNKTKAATESKVAEATLSAEMQLREEIRLAVEKERLVSRQEQDNLQMTIDDLRHTIQRHEMQISRTEQDSRLKINDLRQRLNEAESRNEELAQNISHATRPFLRQIENLQTTYITQINSLEKTERQLTDRLAEMQAQYATSLEHERISNETLLETNAKWKLAEAQLSTLKQDKSRLSSELDILKIKLNNLEDSRQREKVQIESMQDAFTQQINSLIQEKKQIELNIELERSKQESELKRLQILNESLREQRDLSDANSLTRTNSNLESTLSQQRSRRSSGGHESSMLFSFERSPFVLQPKPSVYESLRHTGALAVLENLEAQLKEKEGEITLLQSEIADLERTRESMARELVNLSTENENLKQQTQNYPKLTEQYKELEKRYDALLTMYGEKQEEADELRLDLTDVKTLYRAQIDDLLKQTSQR